MHNSCKLPPYSLSDFKVGDHVYIPFWVVLASLDVTPPDPFIKCRIIHLGTTKNPTHSCVTEYVSCDLELGKTGLISQGIPLEYLIHHSHIEYWAREIADWFLKYPESCEHSSQHSSNKIINVFT